MRPPRPDIAVPPLPSGTDWIGEPVESIERLLAGQPALVHFLDFAQLNSMRSLPYIRAWRERYEDDGLAVIGVHSPRFPFTRDRGAVADAMAREEVGWPVALDPDFTIWRAYEPHGWPALFLWGRGGVLRWYHLGEGEYGETEEAIRQQLAAGEEREWPAPLEPLRASDAPGASVLPPTPELFPGGAIDAPFTGADGEPPLEAPYEAGGAFAATDGEGRIELSLDGEPIGTIEVVHPGLQELTSHERTERHLLQLSPSPGLHIYSIQFPAAVP
jgi:hypothetical protein